MTATDRPIPQRPAEPTAPLPGARPSTDAAPDAAPERAADDRARARASAQPMPRVTVGGLLRGIHPVLFGVYPVLFLWSQNLGEVSAGDTSDVLGATFLAAGAVMLLAWLAFQDRARGALFVTPGILAFLLYNHVARIGVPVEVERGAIVALLAIALVLALKLPDRWIGRADTGLRILALALIVTTLATIVPAVVEKETTPQAVVAAGKTLPSTTTAQKRDVYWLIFDRYGSDRAFQIGYDTKNPLTPWLKAHGFDVLADSHANYVGTAQSLSTTANLTPLAQLTKGVPVTSNSYLPIYGHLQGSLAVRQFQALGYRYLHLGSWWNPTRYDSAADRNFNADGVSDFTSAVVESSIVPVLSKAFIPKALPPTEPAKHLKHNTYALDKLDQLPIESGPKFVWAHILLPHPPYIFDAEGNYIESPQHAGISDTEAWKGQLEYTNKRLEAFLEQLLSKPEAEQPIIVLQADEGPWPDAYTRDKVGFNWATASAGPARDEVRDPERVVRAGRDAGPGAAPGPDGDQHVPDAVRQVLRARLPEAAGHGLRGGLGPAVQLDRRHRPAAEPEVAAEDDQVGAADLERSCEDHRERGTPCRGQGDDDGAPPSAARREAPPRLQPPLD